MRLLRRTSAVCAALATTALTAASATAGPGREMTCSPVPAADRVLSCTVPLPADVHVRRPAVRVVLPKDYDTSGRDYPVVYVLHGVGDDETSWTSEKRGKLSSLTAACDAIFVTPDGGSGSTAGWYSDWADGSYQWETFHTQVLPKAVDATFRTQGPKHRAIAGLSMGGFGALSYAGRHPGLYQAAASYSGFVDTLFGAPISGEVDQASGQNPVYSTGAPSRRIWGDQTANRDVWAAHNPYDLAASLRGTAVYLSSGTGTPGGAQGDDPTKAASYGLEAYISQLNERLAGQLKAQDVPFTDGRYFGGDHDWPYWRAAFTASLTVLMPAVGVATPGCGA